jgi:DNA-binding beta-propeller fold protein YncE
MNFKLKNFPLRPTIEFRRILRYLLIVIIPVMTLLFVSANFARSAKEEYVLADEFKVMPDSLRFPNDLAVDSAGTVYFMSSMDPRVEILKFDRSGNFTGIWKSWDMGCIPWKDPKCIKPASFAIDKQDNVFMLVEADIMIKMNREGKVLARWNIAKKFNVSAIASIMINDQGMLHLPFGDPKPGVLVLSPQGSLIRRVSISSPDNCRPDRPCLKTAPKIAVDSKGNMYHYDTENLMKEKAIHIRKYNPSGRYAGEHIEKSDSETNCSFFATLTVGKEDSLHFIFQNSVISLDKTMKPVHRWTLDQEDGFPCLNVQNIKSDGDGNLYLFSHDKVEKFTEDGRRVGCYGKVLSDGNIIEPKLLALDERGGPLYVRGANGIQQFTTKGAYVNGWERIKIGKKSWAFLSHSAGLAVDSAGDFYVFFASLYYPEKSEKKSLPTILKFSRTGKLLMSFTIPTKETVIDTVGGIAIDGKDRIFVLASSPYEEKYQRVFVLTNEGTPVDEWGVFGKRDGQIGQGRSIAVDADGNVLILDIGRLRVSKFAPNGKFIHSFGRESEDDDGFLEIISLAADRWNNIYVSQIFGYNCRVQKFDTNGNYITKIHAFGKPESTLRSPFGIAVDSTGAVYVADTMNNRVVKLVSNKNTSEER